MQLCLESEQDITKESALPLVLQRSWLKQADFTASPMFAMNPPSSVSSLFQVDMKAM